MQHAQRLAAANAPRQYALAIVARPEALVVILLVVKPIVIAAVTTSSRRTCAMRADAIAATDSSRLGRKVNHARRRPGVMVDEDCSEPSASLGVHAPGSSASLAAAAVARRAELAAPAPLAIATAVAAAVESRRATSTGIHGTFHPGLRHDVMRDAEANGEECGAQQGRKAERDRSCTRAAARCACASAGISEST